MWSVKTVPKPSSLSRGFGFLVVALVIRIASLMGCPRLEDDRLAVHAEDLPVDVGDLAEARVVLHRIDQDRHHVPAVAAGLRELLEPPPPPGHVPRRLEPPDAFDLRPLPAPRDAEVVDGLLLRPDVLVHAG